MAVIEPFVIVVTSKGTRRVQRDITAIGKSAESTRKLLGFLRGALVVFASISIVRGFFNIVDSLTIMQNRLKLVTGSVQQLNAVQNELFKISQRTGTPVETNTQLFARLTRSTLDQNLSFQELLDITEGVTQALVVSGATGQEARNGLIQFAQGLAAGALRGDELRSVAEQIPELARAIGKEFGVSAGQLIAFANANEGVLLTGKVIDGIRKALPGFAEKFAETSDTIERGFERINNALIFFLGSTAQATGAQQVLVSVLNSVAANIGLIVTALASLAGIVVFNFFTAQVIAFSSSIGSLIGFLRVLGPAIVVFFTNPIGRALIVGQLFGGVTKALTASIAFLTGSLRVLGTVLTFLATNPLGIVISIIGIVVIAFLNFRKELEALGPVGKFVIDVIEGIIAGFSFLLDVVNQAGVALGIFSDDAEDAARKTRSAADVIGDTLGELPKAGDDIVRSLDLVGDEAEKTSDRVVSSFKSIPIIDPFTNQTNAVKVQFRDLEDASAVTAQRITENFSKISGATRSALDGRRGIAQSLQGERFTFGAPGDLRDTADQFGADVVTSIRGGLASQGLTIQFGLRPSDETLLRRQELAGRASAVGVSTSGLPSAKPFNQLFNDFDVLFGRALTTKSLDKFEASVVAAEKALQAETEARERFNRTVESLAVQTARDTGAGSFDAISSEQRDLINQIATLERELSATNELTERINLGIHIDQLRASLDAATDANQQVVEVLSGNVFEQFRQNVFGFRKGGNFTVPGSGGPDSRLVPLALTPGEEVDIRTASQQRRSERDGDTIIKNEITFNVQTPDADSFRRSETQITSRLAQQLNRVQRKI